LRFDRITQMLDRGDRAAIHTTLASRVDEITESEEWRRLIHSWLDDPHAAQARLEAMLGDPGTSMDPIKLVRIMGWAAFLGDPDLSLRAAHKVAGLHVSFETWAFALWRPVMRDVRRTPGFKDLVRELKLDDYWRATGNWGDFCRPAGIDDFT